MRDFKNKLGISQARADFLEVIADRVKNSDAVIAIFLDTQNLDDEELKELTQIIVDSGVEDEDTIIDWFFGDYFEEAEKESDEDE